MKKNKIKVILVAAFALIAGYDMHNSQKAEGMLDLALAHDENGFGCDNGCISNGNGCECHGWHDNLAEYKGH